MSNVTFKMTVATNVGLVRSNNEDNFIVCPDLSVKNNWFVPINPNDVMSLGEQGCVMIVADGMGGMNAGEVASELAVNSIKDSFEKTKDFSQIADCSNHIESFLKRTIVEADAVIKKRVKEDNTTAGMGTTIVVAWVVGDVAHIAWCGDSRAYLFNRSAGLSRLSNDHSYVQELVDSGQLDPELAFDHPNSNIITRSLGDSPNKARPDYVCRRLSTGDYLLLCTDGLCGLCRDEEIMKIMMRDYPRIEDYRNALFNAAFEAGGYDNVTIALMECMKVQESVMATTVVPKSKPKTKTIEKSASNGNSKKASRSWRNVGMTVLVVVSMLVVALVGLYFIIPDESSNSDKFIDNVLNKFVPVKNTLDSLFFNNPQDSTSIAHQENSQEIDVPRSDPTDLKDTTEKATRLGNPQDSTSIAHQENSQEIDVPRSDPTDLKDTTEKATRLGNPQDSTSIPIKTL